MTKAENRNITNLSGRAVLAGLTDRRSFIGVNGARNLPSCGGSIFPTWAGMVISP